MEADSSGLTERSISKLYLDLRLLSIQSDYRIFPGLEISLLISQAEDWGAVAKLSISIPIIVF